MYLNGYKRTETVHVVEANINFLWLIKLYVLVSFKHIKEVIPESEDHISALVKELPFTKTTFPERTVCSIDHKNLDLYISLINYYLFYYNL